MRFAPSPTGRLHVGNLRTALLSYLFIVERGELFLRLDDTDQKRSEECYAEEIRKVLQLMHINYTKEIKQSERTKLYREIFYKAYEVGLIYATFDTKDELQVLKKRLEVAGLPRAYKKRHMDTSKAKSESTICWRFQLPDKVIKWYDHIKGKMHFDLRSVSDPIVCVQNDDQLSFKYLLASVIDDNYDQITHVMRGDDHLNNTAIQIAMLEALYENKLITRRNIEWYSLPLVGFGSQKMSKRSFVDCSVMTFLKTGIHPLALAHYLVELGSPIPLKVAMTLKDLALQIQWSHFSSAAPQWSTKNLLNWQKKILSNLDYSQLSEFWYDLTKVRFTSKELNLIQENVLLKSDILLWHKVLHSKELFVSDLRYVYKSVELSHFKDTFINDLLIDDKIDDSAIIKEVIRSRSINCVHDNKRRILRKVRYVVTGVFHGPELNLILSTIDDNILQYRLTGVSHDETDLQLFNTAINKKEVVNSTIGIKMYVCGPTLYSSPHIGNARSFVFFDVLYRLLRFKFKSVTYARNLTDIDDKIIEVAKKRKITCTALTDEILQQFNENCTKLNLLLPTYEPKVSDYIPNIISDIQTMIQNGVAYATDNGHVFFDTKSCRSYKHIKNSQSRIEKSTDKHHDSDFVLWKPVKDEVEIWPNGDKAWWDSPWGKGRPGWHIECTSMIKELFQSGESALIPAQKWRDHLVDIHGGGIDLQFPHHYNEQVQCWGLDCRCAKFWIHNAFVKINDEKMSKSLSNDLAISELLQKYNGNIVRLALIKTHYRSELLWRDNTIQQSAELYAKLRIKYADYLPIQPEHNHEVLLYLYEDINVPAALTYICNHVSGESLYVLQEILGIDIQQTNEEQNIDTDYVEQKIAERNSYRQVGEYEKADAIRLDLLKQGIKLEDIDEDTHWKVCMINS